MMNQWKLKHGERLFLASLLVAFITLTLDYAFHNSLTSPMEIPTYFAMKFFSALVIAYFLLPRIGILFSALAFTLWVDVYYGVFVVVLGIQGLSSSPTQLIEIAGVTNPFLLLPLWTLAHGLFFLAGAILGSGV